MTSARPGLALPGGPPPARPGSDAAPASPWRERATFALDAVLHAYSQVLFARSRPIGVLLLLASFTVPAVGIVGLLGVVLAGGLALLLQMDRTAVRDGVLGYNALLVFLAIGAMADRSMTFWTLAAVAAAITVIVHVALSGALAFHFRLPVLSLPFVAVTWLLMGAAPHLRGLAFHGHPPALDLGPFPGPGWLDGLLRGLGAIFFQPHWPAGLLVLVALVAWSRIATVHALIGYAVAVAAGTWWFTFPEEQLHLYIGFNFIVTAIALGGIFYVPSPAATAVAAVGTIATGLVSVGLMTLLAPVGLPVLAAPFNLTVLVALYAMGQRTRDSQPRTVDFVAGTPEDNLLWWRTRVRRFRASLPVRLQLPVQGSWTCTQGHDGAYTHQGAWRHGVDLEVLDADGLAGRGDRLEDVYAYRLPVVAPAAGTVVRVVDGYPDTPVGEVDTTWNWGNAVVLQHAPTLFTLLGHLSPGTLAVKEGEVVAAGARVGLCGASGRAPMPHVHFHAQTTPLIGDPTCEAPFHGLVREVEGAAELLDDHVPVEGERLRNLKLDKGLAAALSWPPGRSHRMKLTADGVTREEEVRSEVDLVGARSLRNPRTGAVLWFEDRGQAFYAYDYTGPGDDALFVLYIALLQVPYDDTPRLQWRDALESRRVHRGWLTWWADALAAFVPPPSRPMRFELHRAGPERRVAGRSAATRWHPELTSEAVLRPGVGLVRATVRLGDRQLALETLENPS